MSLDKAKGRMPNAERVTAVTLRPARATLRATTAALLLIAASVSLAGAQPARAARASFPNREKALEMAAAEASAGRRDEAKRLLAQTARRYQSVQALMQLARLEVADGNAAAAIDVLDKARTLAPNSEDVLSASAQVSLAAHLVTPALVSLQALTRICPEVAEYHYLMGVGLMQAGDMIMASESLQRADALEPNRPLTLIALGLAMNNRKVYDGARQYLLRALEREPDSIEATAALAEAEDGLGDSTAAEAHARRVLEKAPGNATATLVVGLALMKQGRFADARDAFQRAAAADPNSPKPVYQLSLAYARLGDEANSQKQRELYQQKLREMEARVVELRKRTGLPSNGGMRP